MVFAVAPGDRGHRLSGKPLFDLRVRIVAKKGNGGGIVVQFVQADVELLHHLRGHGQGNLVVHVSVKIPKKLKKDQEELLRQYADSAGLDVSDKKKGLFGRKK